MRQRTNITNPEWILHSTQYAYAGLCTSNAIAEIIAKHFDDALRQAFIGNGVIYYERYIDDSILILNEHVEESEVKEKLEKILLSIFYDEGIGCTVKCKTNFNRNKFQYISRRKILLSPCSVDFLGYEFWFSHQKSKIEIKYGITEAKREKYNARIDKLISCYTDSTSPDYNNLELLRHRIAAFSSREVYLTRHFRSNVWRVKGFISNYGELRYLLETGLIEDKTEIYLKNMVSDAFDRAKIPEPYFLMGNTKLDCGYNLYGKMDILSSDSSENSDWERRCSCWTWLYISTHFIRRLIKREKSFLLLLILIVKLISRAMITLGLS